MNEQSMFEKYGGFSKISRVVLSFYDTLLDSDDIGVNKIAQKLEYNN